MIGSKDREARRVFSLSLYVTTYHSGTVHIPSAGRARANEESELTCIYGLWTALDPPFKSDTNTMCNVFILPVECSGQVFHFASVGVSTSGSVLGNSSLSVGLPR